MNQNARELASAQPLNGGEAAGTITIDVAAKLLMVTSEWVRRLTKDGWNTKTERKRYRVVDVVRGSGALEGASAMRPPRLRSASDAAL
jgi:hypothetical protein